MSDIRFYIGPMSKNVVDAVIEFDGNIGFIPSRRQVDYNGGYVNNWTTGEFATYVDGRAVLQRDHGGAGQGYIHDDGFDSFIHDSIYFDKIHIDPWKEYQDFEIGLQQTIDNINFIYIRNQNVKFENSEFSINAFTTEAGRSTTSPAAILLANDSGNKRTFDIFSLERFY